MSVGIEIPSADLIASLGAGLSGLADALDASGATYAVVGADRTEVGGAPSVSPTVAGALLARRTKNIGLVLAASPQRDHPYNIARRVASVDHVSGGRAGFLALRRDRVLEFGVGDGSSWVEAPIGAGELADVVIGIRKLWRTWPIETLDADPTVSESAVIRFATHFGVFNTKGPLNSPTTPQGEPVVFWKWDGGGGHFQEEFSAARSADIIVVDAAGVEDFLSTARAALDAVTAAGQRLQIHVRAPLADPHDLAVIGWRDNPAISGVTLVPDAGNLIASIKRLLPPWVAAIRADAAGTTLRDRLAIPYRKTPDISSNAALFVPAAKELA